MNLAAGLQAAGLDGAGAFAGRDKANRGLLGGVQGAFRGHLGGGLWVSASRSAVADKCLGVWWGGRQRHVTRCGPAIFISARFDFPPCPSQATSQTIAF